MPQPSRHTLPLHPPFLAPLCPLPPPPLSRLMAAEVMWTPEEADDTLLPEDVTLDFPTLIPL